MILRVWALYDKSRFILATLLPLLATEVVSCLANSIVISTRYNSLGKATQVLDLSLCVPQASLVVPAEVGDISQLTLGALMCLFIAIRFTRRSFEMYKVTKQYRLGRYMNLLTREGIFYFFVIVTFALINSLTLLNVLSGTWWGVAEYVPVFTLVPRFFLSLRELYARDFRGRCGGDIDTAFGFTSAGDGAVESMVMFVDAEQGEGSGQDGGIEMKESRGAADGSPNSLSI